MREREWREKEWKAADKKGIGGKKEERKEWRHWLTGCGNDGEEE